MVDDTHMLPSRSPFGSGYRPRLTMERVLGSLVAFILGLVAFFPFLGVAQCNGDCIVYTTTLWGLRLSEPVGATIGVVAGVVLATATYRSLDKN